MSFPLRQDHLLSEAEYLAGEELSDVKHEFLNGVVHAMAGGSTQHAQISGRIFGAFFQRLRGRRCEPFNSDMRLRIQRGDDLRHYYPDVMIVCDPRPTEPWQDTPSVIFEVLSKGTARTDIMEKREAYCAIPSLDAYVLVDSRRVEVQCWRRTGSEWKWEVWRSLDSVLDLPTLECQVPLAEFYEGVTLVPDPEEI